MGVWLAVFLGLMGAPIQAAENKYPLESINLSSPRSTMQGFLASMDKIYEGLYGPEGMFSIYMKSGQLYPTEEEISAVLNYQNDLTEISRALDLSRLPPSTSREFQWQIAILLKEVLDRIELPAFESIPDEKTLADAGNESWMIPHTDIEIIGKKEPGHGLTFRFSADTIERLPEFYEKVRELPYHPGASKDWYDKSMHDPAGLSFALRHLIPPRWFYGTPHWARQVVLDQPLWRWAGIVAVLAGLLGLLLLVDRATRLIRRTRKNLDEWATLTKSGLLVVLTPYTIHVLVEILKVTGPVYQLLTLILWVIFYLALAHLVWNAGNALGEWIIRQEKIQSGSLDGQIIRLMIRLLTTLLAISLVIVGANRIGLPAYSVLAGLGIGGLAVALAAQQTLSNLFGSLIILFEKPFTVNQIIEYGNRRGKVSRIGLRSSSIRTADGAEVIVPNSELISKEVVNWSRARGGHRLAIILNLPVDSDVQSVTALMLDVTKSHTEILEKPEPTVSLNAISKEGLEFQLSAWVRQYEDASRISGRLRTEIWRQLDQARRDQERG